VRGTLLVVIAVAALAAAGARAAAPVVVKATLAGTCTLDNTLDSNGVVTRSTLSCRATGTCTCGGAATRLLYQAAAVSPGNGEPGREQGTLTATGAHGSVALSLVGTRTALGLSKGTWALRKASGMAGAGLEKRGAYTTETTELEPISGTTSTTVRISAAIGCWACQPQG
jgi:hypothetical protein